MFAENPMADPGKYVIHTGNPVIVARVYIFASEIDAREFSMPIRFGAMTVLNGEYYVLAADLIMYEGDVPDATQKEADKLAAVLRRAADWLHAYLKFQKENDNPIHFPQN